MIRATAEEMAGRDRDTKLFAASNHKERNRVAPPTGPRGTPRQSCARRPPRSGLCSAVLGCSRPTRASGVFSRCRRAGCRSLRVTGLGAHGISPGRLRPGRRDGIFLPSPAWGSRLLAGGRLCRSDASGVGAPASALGVRPNVRSGMSNM